MTSDRIRIASWMALWGRVAGAAFSLGAFLSMKFDWLTLVYTGLSVALLSILIGFGITKIADRRETESDS